MAFRMLPLYLHTVSGMEPRQLVGVFERKFRQTLVPHLPVDFDQQYERRIPALRKLRISPFQENTATVRACMDDSTRRCYRQRVRSAAEGELTLLNQTTRVEDLGTVDWTENRFSDQSPLWRLKVHGFEPLSWCVFGFAGREDGAEPVQRSFDEWIDGWIRTVEVGGAGYLRGKWTPHAVSLRVLYWIRYLAWKLPDQKGTVWTPTAPFDKRLCQEVYKNALFLENHIEYDVGGNHLIENGAALFAAGFLFRNRSWIQDALSLLNEVGDKQFLADGGHFERSPMYHTLTTTRYLTVYDLLQQVGGTVPSPIEETTRAGVEFLEFIRPPDDRIPLLNDSVHGEAMPLTTCLRYAEAIGITPDDKTTSIGGESGYFWLPNQSGKLLVDGGPVGPRHLPGHSHNDLLQFLLWIDGSRIVTDTGVFDYQSGERRDYARGIRGHNTVQVDETEPIEIGGRYLMGARTSPRIRYQPATEATLFEGVYETRSLFGIAYRHHRAIYKGERWWLIWDQIHNAGDARVRSRVHLRPGVSVTRTEGAGFVVNEDSDEVAAFSPVMGTIGRTDDGCHFPRFGEAIPRSVLEFEPTGRDPLAFGFLIRPPALTRVNLTLDTVAVPTEITVGDVTYKLPAAKLGKSW